MCLKAFLFRGHLVFIIIAVTLYKRLVTVITFPQVPASHHSREGDQNWNTLDIPLHLTCPILPQELRCNLLAVVDERRICCQPDTLEAFKVSKKRTISEILQSTEV